MRLAALALLVLAACGSASSPSSDAGDEPSVGLCCLTLGAVAQPCGSVATCGDAGACTWELEDAGHAGTVVRCP